MYKFVNKGTKIRRSFRNVPYWKAVEWDYSRSRFRVIEFDFPRFSGTLKVVKFV